MLVSLLILSTVCLPLLGQNRSLSERVVCANNLRILGLAYESWGSDNGTVRHFRVFVDAGGTKGVGKFPTPYREYRVLAAYLASPRVLACPSDPKVKTASSWTTSPSGGFHNPAYQNNAVSYFIGLDADASLPDSFLAGDRDLRVISPAVNCSATGANNASLLAQRGSADGVAAWTNRLHAASGNILFNDGRVEALSTPELRAAAAKASSDGDQCHILTPQTY